jgi:hypothetical protein
LIVTTLGGSLMVSRLLRKGEPLSLACRHLEEYLEMTVRARKSKSRAERSRAAQRKKNAEERDAR